MKEKILLLLGGFVLGILIDKLFFYGKHNIELKIHKDATEYVLENLEQCSNMLLVSLQTCDVIMEISNDIEERNRYLSIENARLLEHR
jgi:hypothetical protein